MAESLAKGWRPLEPDAGNAVEGSEGPIAGLATQPCAQLRTAFCFMNVSPNEIRDLSKAH